MTMSRPAAGSARPRYGEGDAGDVRLDGGASPRSAPAGTAATARGRRRRRAGRCCPGWSTCTPTCASPAARTPRRSRPARGGRGARAASPPCTPWPTPTRWPTPPASSSRSGGSAGGRPGRRRPVGAVTVGLGGEQLAELGAMADSAAAVRVFSDDGNCVSRRRAHAPRPGVRQGVRRRHRPARPGAAAHRGRADERGRAVRPARPARLAGGRRGGDHRPRRAARRARRLPAARVPRLDGRLGRDHPLGQVARHRRHRRGDPAPPAAHRGPRRSYDPVFKVNPPLRTAEPTSRRCAPAWPTARSTRRHRPRPAPAEDKECEWAGPPRSACSASRPRSRSWSTRWSTPGGSTGRQWPPDVRPPARIGRRTGPRPAARRRRAGQPVLVDPAARWTVDPRAHGHAQPEHPYAGRELPAPVVATFLRGRPTVLDGAPVHPRIGAA
jgi:dihydroorotase